MGNKTAGRLESYTSDDFLKLIIEAVTQHYAETAKHDDEPVSFDVDGACTDDDYGYRLEGAHVFDHFLVGSDPVYTDTARITRVWCNEYHDEGDVQLVLQIVQGDDNILVRLNGSYFSYDGAEWGGDIDVVKQYNVTVPMFLSADEVTQQPGVQGEIK